MDYSYTPHLGWSHSRFETFMYCKRKYYYTYYSRFVTDDRVKDLKELLNIQLSTGKMGHECIKMILERLCKSNTAIDNYRLFKLIDSKVNKFMDENSFSEVSYNTMAFSELLQMVLGNVHIIIKSFLKSSRFEWIRTKATKVSKSWVIDSEGYGETRIEGMKAYCKPDFLIPNLDEISYIFDWKSGMPSKKDESQLCGYKWVACNEYDIPRDKLVTIAAYIFPKYDEKIIDITDYMYDKFPNVIKLETTEMNRYCEDVSQNIPKKMEEFEMASKNKCRICNFRILCGR